MVSKEELLKFDTLNAFTSQELAKLAAIAHIFVYKKDEKIFAQGESLTNLYLMDRGEVVLTFELNKDVTLIFSHLRPGTFFGITGLCAEKTFQNAYCLRPSQVIVFPLKKLEELFVEDKRLGFKLYYELLKLYHKIAQKRTLHTLKLLKERKDLKNLDFVSTMLDFSG